MNLEHAWSKKELEILKKYYPIMGSSELAKLLPGRARTSIVQKAYRLGIQRENYRWTKQELEILRKHYPSTASNEEITAMLPNRTFYSIKTKAKLLKIRRGNYVPTTKESTVRRWTRDEIDIVQTYYRQIPYKQMEALLPGRSVIAIAKMAKSLKMSTIQPAKEWYQSGERWTSLEEKILIDNYDNQPNEVLMQLFPSRTFLAIKAKASDLGLKRPPEVWASRSKFRPWKQDEKDILKKYWNKKSIEEIAEIIGTKSAKSAIAQGEKLKLPPYDKEKFYNPKPRGRRLFKK